MGFPPLEKAACLAVAVTLCACPNPSAKAPQAPQAPPSWGTGWGSGKPTEMVPAAERPGAVPNIPELPRPPSTNPDTAGTLPPGHPPLDGTGGAQALPPASPGGQAPQDAVHGGMGTVAPPTGSRVGRSGTDWGGGDPAVGNLAFQALCVRCHGEAGRGGTVVEGTMVADLGSARVQALGDADLAAVIAQGRGVMPSFMGQLDLAKLRGLVAHLRTLKR